MKTPGLCFILVLAGFGFGWTGHQQVLELRRRNAELRQSVAEVAQCQQAARTPEVVDPKELARLREEWSELMRLRSELGRLRQAARLELPQLERQTEKTVAEAAQELKRGPGLLEDRAAKLHSALVQSFLNYNLLNPLRQAAQGNGGQFPGSFAEAARVLGAVPADNPHGARWMQQALSQTNTLSAAEADLVGQSFSVSAHDFEFVPSAQPLTLQGPPVPLLREATARLLPDGRSARWFGFTDGRIEEIVSSDGRIPDLPSAAAQGR